MLPELIARLQHLVGVLNLDEPIKLVEDEPLIVRQEVLKHPVHRTQPIVGERAIGWLLLIGMAVVTGSVMVWMADGSVSRAVALSIGMALPMLGIMLRAGGCGGRRARS